MPLYNEENMDLGGDRKRTIFVTPDTRPINIRPVINDRDRFQTALFAPARHREALFALYAFNYEIARVRETITEPMLGQIRLQWWREVIAAAFAGEMPAAKCCLTVGFATVACSASM